MVMIVPKNLGLWFEYSPRWVQGKAFGYLHERIFLSSYRPNALPLQNFDSP
jgi:hypothetical protein